MMGRCLVTGATGFVGQHLVRALCGRRYQVRCLVRKTSDVSPLAGLPVTFADGDLTDARGLEKAVAGVDYVFHAGGLIKAWRQSDFETVNAAGTGWLLEACRQANPGLRRFVLVSSLAACGPSPHGAPLTEEASPKPTSEYGRSKRSGELIAASYGDDVPCTVIRPPVVYGPGDRQTFALFRLANLGLRPSLGQIRFSLVHISDLVAGLMLAAESDVTVGRTYFVSGEETASLQEIMQFIVRGLGRRSLSVPVPYRLTWSVACLAELGSGVLRRPVLFDRYKARDFYRTAWCCDAGLARKELGFEQQVPLEEGLRNTALWYREHGWLR